MKKFELNAFVSLEGQTYLIREKFSTLSKVFKEMTAIKKEFDYVYRIYVFKEGKRLFEERNSSIKEQE